MGLLKSVLSSQPCLTLTCKICLIYTMSKPFYCQPCELPLNSLAQYNSHLDGDKHIKKTMESGMHFDSGSKLIVEVAKRNEVFMPKSILKKPTIKFVTAKEDQTESKLKSTPIITEIIDVPVYDLTSLSSTTAN